jgi:acyl-CoA synthetase (AMP-forming)/AMP-acid ligase II
VIRQDSLLAATRNSLTYYGLTRDARTVCFFPFHFDASYETIFTMLVAGGSLVIPARETVRIPRMYIETLVNEGVTHANISPSFLRLLLASPTVEDLASSKLTTLSLMGEACWAPDLQRLLSIHPKLRVFNRYGPTEATITVSTYEVDAAELRGKSQVPIGSPDPGVVFVMVDDSGAVLEAANTVGELYVGGVQLMAGYWHDADSSALRDDLVAGTRLYRTRDLVVREESGDYVYVDRNDNIIKRNGVRISLEEIAATLMQIDAVISAICVASPRRDNVVELAAFVTISAPTSEVELRRALRTRLPASMLPNVIRVVDEIPMTAAGKVNTAELRLTIWPESSATNHHAHSE